MSTTKEEKIQELKERIKILKSDVEYYDSKQTSAKLILNGSYGAFANQHFCFFDNDIAGTVTAMGRNLIQLMDRKNEQYFYEHWHKDVHIHKLLGIKTEDIKPIDGSYLDQYNSPYFLIDRTGTRYETARAYEDLYEMSLDKLEKWAEAEADPKIREIFNEVVLIKHNEIKRKVSISIYADTDSVDGSSTIRTNKGIMTIAEMYDYCSQYTEPLINVNGNNICDNKSDLQIFNWTNEKSYHYTDFKYVMKHKVTKKAFNIKLKSGKSIKVTDDHSMIVFRNGSIEKITVKPSEILNTDTILIYSDWSETGVIDHIDCIEETTFENENVYDIEVIDDSHTFIANDILVHNSLFVAYQPAMDSCNWQGDPMDFINTLNKNRIQKYFTNILDKYALKNKVENIEDFELERIDQSVIFLEKKCYVQNVVWEDGIPYKPLSYMPSKGIEIVKSSTPKFARERAMELIKYLFAHPKDYKIQEVLNIVKELKKAFMWCAAENIEDVSMSCSMNNYEKGVIEDTKELKFNTGAHFSVKAAAFHNYLLKKNPEMLTKYEFVKSGNKIKYYYTKNALHETFGYNRGSFPTEFAPEIDLDLQFEKSVLNIINRFMGVLNMPIINKRISVVMALFK